jgi:hypothetical protein
MTRRREDLIGAATGVIVVMPIAASIIIGLFWLLIDVLNWLDKAVWPVYSLRDFLKHFEIEIGTTGAKGFDLLVSYALATSIEIYLVLIWPVIWLSLWLWLLNLIFYGKPKT